MRIGRKYFYRTTVIQITQKIFRRVKIEQLLITCFKLPDILFQLAPRIVWLLAPFLYQILSRWSTPQTCPLLLTDTLLHIMILIVRIVSHNIVTETTHRETKINYMFHRIGIYSWPFPSRWRFITNSNSCKYSTITRNSPNAVRSNRYLSQCTL